MLMMTTSLVSDIPLGLAFRSSSGSERADRTCLLWLCSELTALTGYEVMAHVVAGKLNKQIAAHLRTGEQAIKVHRGREMEKIGVDWLADLVRAAVRLGIVK
jgi:FixJ family two-component response regulator